MCEYLNAKGINSDVITSDVKQSCRNKILQNSELRVVLNCKCITEGVDINYFDTALFYDDSDDQIRVIQALGRLMRKQDNKTKIAKFVILTTDINKESQLNKLNEYMTMIKTTDFNNECSVSSYNNTSYKNVYQIKQIKTEKEFNKYYYTEIFKNSIEVKNIRERQYVELKTNIKVLKGCMFNNNSVVEYFKIPDTVTEIGKNYFINCVNLKMINLENVVKIDETSFLGCKSLKKYIKQSILNINSKCKF